MDISLIHSCVDLGIVILPSPSFFVVWGNLREGLYRGLAMPGRLTGPAVIGRLTFRDGSGSVIGDGVAHFSVKQNTTIDSRAVSVRVLSTSFEQKGLRWDVFSQA